MRPRAAYSVISRLLGTKGWFWCAFAICSSVVLAMTDYGIALFIEVLLVNLGLAGDSARTVSWAGDWLSSETFLLLGLGAIGLLRGLAQFGMFQGCDLVHELVNSRLRMLSGYEVLKDPSGNFVSAADTNLKVGEIFPKSAMFMYYGVTLVAMAIQCLVYLVVMLYTAWQEALLGIIGAGFIGAVVITINRRVRRVARRIPAEQQGLVKDIQRTASNWLLVKAFRTSELEHQSLIRRNLNYFRLFVRAKTLANFGAVVPLIAGVGLLMLIIYSSLTFFNTPGMELIACIYLFGRFSMIAGRVAKGVGVLASHSAHFVAAAEFISHFDAQVVREATAPLDAVTATGGERPGAMPETRPDVAPRADSEAAVSAAPPVTLDHVTFAYTPDSAPVFSELSLSVEAGSQVGIVGRSGSGKSTMLGLIFGILHPQAGAVRVGDAEPENYFRDHPHALGYVGSEPFLLEGSIKDNLDYGSDGSYPTEAYRQVLESVHLQQFVDELPGGLAYHLPENGEGLSAGQKQRLSLARSLLRKPQVLILDEVTSNLDDAMEQEIAGILLELKTKCTVIIVSHRRGVLKYADAVYELDESKQLRLLNSPLADSTRLTAANS